MKSLKSIIFSRFLLVIAVAFAVVAMSAVALTVRSAHQLVIADARNSLRFIASNIRSSYSSQLEALDRLAKNQAFDPSDQAGLARAVDDFLHFHPIFATVYVYRPSGELILARRDHGLAPNEPKANFHDKAPQFVKLAEQVIQTKTSQTSETFYSPNGYLYQLYLVPVLGADGSVVALLSGGVFPNLRNLNRLVDGLALADDNFLFVVNNKGTLLAETGRAPGKLPEIGTLDVIDCSSLTDVAIGQTSFLEAARLWLSANRSPYILFTQPIDDLKIVVKLGISKSRIQAKIDYILRNLFAGFVLCFVVALAAAFVLGRRLAEPLEGLLDAAREMNRGNFDHQLPKAGHGEFGELSAYLDEIRAKIKKDRVLGELWHDKLS